MRLLLLPRYSALGASSRLRLLQYVPALRRAGIVVEVSWLLGDDYVRGLYAGSVPKSNVVAGYATRLLKLAGASKFDAVWLEKEALPWLPTPLEHAMLIGCRRLVIDYDDAVFHRYDRHRSRLVRTVLGRKIDRVMARADLVTAGNDYLAGRARDAGARRIEWLPTVVDLDRYPLVERPMPVPGQPLTIGWMGSPATAAYLKDIEPALAPLVDAGRIRCVAVGARADQVAGTCFQSQPWSEDSEAAALQDFDVGVMPLPDEPWEHGKCGYKLVQYMASGLPVVASPVGANRRIVQHGVNGLLAETPAQWASALDDLANAPALRAAMGQAGRNIVEETYSLQAQAPRVVQMCQALMGQRPCAA